MLALLLLILQSKKFINQLDRCLLIDREDKFINYLLIDDSFRSLSSREKIKEYKKNGLKVGNNVKIHNGSVLIGNKIEIEDNVSIGNDTYIESPEIYIGTNTTIESGKFFQRHRTN